MLLGVLRNLSFTWEQTKMMKLDRLVPYEDDWAYGDPEMVTI